MSKILVIHTILNIEQTKMLYCNDTHEMKHDRYDDRNVGERETQREEEKKTIEPSLRVLLSLLLSAGLSTWLQRSCLQQKEPGRHWRSLEFRQPLCCVSIEVSLDGNFVKQTLPRHMYPWGTHSG